MGFWVNGTAPSFNVVHDSASDTAPPPPPNPFAYSHYAFPTSSQGTLGSFIYHQVNGSFIAEEAYDAGARMWVTTLINVTALAEASLALLGSFES